MLDMTVQAYAKINLGLRILRKREDGYHDIETVFHRIDIADELVFEPSTTVTMESTDPSLPVNEENLCLRAARLLQSECAPVRGAHIRLTKRIPAGAGLGGGSADAAATLLGLNAFWQLRLSDAMLSVLALRVGSDVPYFLKNGSASASGRGEFLDYFDLDLPYAIVTVVPGVRVSTAWAYANVQPAQRSVAPALRTAWTAHLREPEYLRRTVENDFEAAVIKAHPVIGVVRNRLTSAGACFSQMTGSGSAVYGLFEELPRALDALVTLGGEHTVFLTRPHFRPAR